MSPEVEAEIARTIGENLAKSFGMKLDKTYDNIVIKVYGQMYAFALAPSLLTGGYKVPEGPITEAEYLRRKKVSEDWEKGRLLYEQAKELGFYADCDCDD